MKSDRREFIKKALYTTPTVIMLGTIIKPTKANSFDRCPSDPDTTNTETEE